MNAIDYTTIPEQRFDCEELQELHDTLRIMDGCWRAAKSAGIEHDLLRTLVYNFKDASHAYQRARWGVVRVPVRVAALLR